MNNLIPYIEIMKNDKSGWKIMQSTKDKNTFVAIEHDNPDTLIPIECVLIDWAYRGKDRIDSGLYDYSGPFDVLPYLDDPKIKEGMKSNKICYGYFKIIK